MACFYVNSTSLDFYTVGAKAISFKFSKLISPKYVILLCGVFVYKQSFEVIGNNLDENDFFR